MRYLIVGVALLALGATGCTASVGGPSNGVPTPTAASAAATGTAASSAPGSATSAPQGSAGTLSPSIMDPILADAAGRSGQAPESLVVVSATARTWPDAGLGCPVPGMVYTQVPVDGYQVVVQAGAVTYDYRGTGPGKFRLCTAAPG